MASVSDGNLTEKPRRRSRSDVLETWNRKLHYYLGLYFLFFLWLFSLSGLLLNHGNWRFAQFWPNREETTWEQTIRSPAAGSDLERADDLVRQLGLTGELDLPREQQGANVLAFNVNRPGKMTQVRADLARERATVKQIRTNAWGVVHVLHTFSGVRMGAPHQTRDWIMTRLWVFSMDALAVGMLIMVLGSYYMWYRLRARRRLGLGLLAAGFASCALFAAGLAWIG